MLTDYKNERSAQRNYDRCDDTNASMQSRAPMGTTPHNELRILPAAGPRNHTLALEPKSVMLWHQQPGTDPSDCVTGSEGELGRLKCSPNRPITCATISAAMPGVTPKGWATAAADFRAANENGPSADKTFPPKGTLKYPRQCGALCMNCNPRHLIIGLQIIDALKLAVKAIGGFKVWVFRIGLFTVAAPPPPPAPKRTSPNETTQSKVPKRKFQSERSQTTYPKRKFLNERFQGIESRRSIPTGSSQAKDPKRRFTSE